jgi:glycosyltransferase involved in cell wall biosynthesis
MEKNIIFDCERMKYPYTGLYNFCFQLGNALLEHIDTIKENISFYMPSSAGKMFGSNAHYIPQNIFHKLWLPTVKPLTIWHSTNQDTSYMPADSKVRCVLTIHDLNFFYEHKDSPGKIKKSLRKIQKQIDHADRICAISEFVKKDIERNLELHSKTVEVIYNGCNISFTENLALPEFIPQGPFIFTIGTIMAKKNFHVLPPLLRDNNMQLIISGITLQEEYEMKIREEAYKCGVQDRVILTGSISDNDKEWYLKNCDAFVFPSLAEGFGLPVVEAMAFGKPVFLSTSTSLPEIGGDLAYYFNSFDADEMVNTFQTGMKHYNQFKPGDAIKERAHLFSWDKAATKYMEIYRDLY